VCSLVDKGRGEEGGRGGGGVNLLKHRLMSNEGGAARE